MISSRHQHDVLPPPPPPLPTLRRRWSKCDTDDDEDFLYDGSYNSDSSSYPVAVSRTSSIRSLTFASRVFDEPIPGPPSIPVRKKSGNGSFCDDDDADVDADADDEDEDTSNNGSESDNDDGASSSSFAEMTLRLQNQKGIICCTTPRGVKKTTTPTRFANNTTTITRRPRSGSILKKTSKFT